MNARYSSGWEQIHFDSLQVIVGLDASRQEQEGLLDQP